MSDFFVWNIDPELFRIGAFGPRYYGLMFAIGFLVSYHLMQKVFRKEGRNEEDLSSLLMHIMLGTILGARLGHCLFYEPGYYLSNPIQILYIWRGGLASHGGTIGVLIASWLYIRKHKDQPFLWLLSRIAPSVAFTGACIRTGNFFNSEILGKPSELPWAVIFKRYDTVPRHPAMLYEALCYLVIFLILQWRYNRDEKDLEQRRQIGLFFVMVFGVRFVIEFVKENQVSFEQGMTLNMGQILSLPLILLGGLMIAGVHKKFLKQTSESAEYSLGESRAQSNKGRKNYRKLNKKANKKR